MAISLSDNKLERTFLVGAAVKQSHPLFSIDDSLRELALLCKTAGLEVVGQASQMLNQIEPATYIGTGKVDEVRQAISDHEATVVVFDDELSPRHQRELEKIFGSEIKLLDRSALILDIFAQHARTREGALQVELAQYEYRLPRLTRQWTHLARQAGGGSSRGVGVRGPGETQLEVDRREIRRRIRKLYEELELVRQHRQRHRQQRTLAQIPVVALVGYTNAGKSTLLNALADADVYVADQLFATLDPTTRRVELPTGRVILFTDTVGFIQKLPTTLIAAFRATLEEILEADLLLHVVDASHPNVLQHIEAVEDTLAEIDAASMSRLLVWNKCDLGANDTEIRDLESYDSYVGHLNVSARTGEGLETLLIMIDTELAKLSKSVTLLLPYDRGDLVSMLHRNSTVIEVNYLSNGVEIRVNLPPTMFKQFQQYLIEG